jgi:hypothetical protein
MCENPYPKKESDKHILGSNFEKNSHVDKKIKIKKCIFVINSRNMNAFVKNTALLSGLLIFSLVSFSQCEILNRVSPDGSMVYYMEPVNFYWTKAKSLSGGISTDKESYFLELFPLPFPEKPAGNDLKDNLELKLSDGKTYTLEHYDTRYIHKDTVMKLVYLINKKDVDILLNLEVTEAKINMKGDEGFRTYVFKLHKEALKEQLDCFLNEEKDKKK